MDQKTCNFPNDETTCIRLRNANGDFLSILPCGADPETGRIACVDLATPEGKVLYCGIDNALVDIFIEYLGLEKID